MRWNKKKLLLGLLLIGLVLVGLKLFRRAPEDVSITFQYGAAKNGLRSLEVNVFRDSDDAHVTRLFYGYGAVRPDGETAKLKLAKTFYRFEIALEYPGETRNLVRKIEIRGGRRILIDVSDAAWAP